ncbi:DUF2961 domain-containing protein [bacterium]|nr:DUF2961 domain-containing protein [bacterium]
METIKSIHLRLAFLIGLSLLAVLSGAALAQNPVAPEHSFELARRLYVDDLAFPRDYRAGKYTAYGNPTLGGQKTVVELSGPGVLTRLWTTQMHDSDLVKLFIYVDGSAEPVLAGPSRELAAAAQGLSSPAAPWGGFLDGKSVSLYLPIPFSKSLRIDAQYEQDLLDGPYWQVDYKKCPVSAPIAWKQVNGSDGIRIVPAGETEAPTAVQKRTMKTVAREVRASAWPADILIDGPAVIRAIHINSNYLNQLLLRIAFDAPGGYGDPNRRMDHVDFQVDAPLKYLVSDFKTAPLELSGTTASLYFPMPVRRQALLQLQVIMEEQSFHEGVAATVTVEYEPDPAGLDRMYYFHAQANTAVGDGYEDVEVLSARGKGHFVGVNLFDTSHDHGGGDNIFFDAGTPTAGQLHGICGEDYFHHAYMRTGVSAPYVHCPTHSARTRQHIELPIPFEDSFTFDWGVFKGVMPKAVAFWYQKELTSKETKDLTYTVSGPFRLEQFGSLAPGKALPDSVYIRKTDKTFARKLWSQRAQNGFVELCHAYRQYANTIPPSPGDLEFDCCYFAETRIWAARAAETMFLVGCDDRIQVYLNGKLLGENPGRQEPDPYRQFTLSGKLNAGENRVRVVLANTTNFNWKWTGFSLCLQNDLGEGQMMYMY